MNNFLSRCTFISLKGFILLGFSLSFCQEVQQAANSQKATATLIAYFETLVSKNILKSENLKSLCQYDVLINPLSQEEMYLSAEVFTHHKQIGQLIEKGGSNLFDVHEIKKWASGKLLELEEHKIKRDAVYEITQDLHRPMAFFPIPAGNYRSAFDNTEFEIPEGYEIQDIPTTQWQWAQQMGENPAEFKDATDSEEVVIGSKKIKLRPDCPVECVSLTMIEEYIKKLNDSDKEYHYSLPSLQDYEALLSHILGKNWIDELGHYSGCLEQHQTCLINVLNYTKCGDARIWDVIGNVWEFVRDQVHVNSEIGHLVFGGSYHTKKNGLTNAHSLLRPIYYKKTFGAGLGFRLVRQKKGSEQRSTRVYADIKWPQSATYEDNHWKWDKTCGGLVHNGDSIQFMKNHINEYPIGCQNTLDEMFDNNLEAKEERIDHIKTLELGYLERGYQKIYDSSPVLYMDNLQEIRVEKGKMNDVVALMKVIANPEQIKGLTLKDHSIINVAALTVLSNLRSLDLSNNQINDLVLLRAMPQLIALELSNNKITDISVLKNLRDLRQLNLSENNITNISALQNLQNLAQLDLSQNPINDISPLQGLNYLKRLTLDQNQYRRFKVWNFPTLEKKVIIVPNNEEWEKQKFGRNLQAIAGLGYFVSCAVIPIIIIIKCCC